MALEKMQDLIFQAMGMGAMHIAARIGPDPTEKAIE
jgi:hypothetical protein